MIETINQFLDSLPGWQFVIVFFGSIGLATYLATLPFRVVNHVVKTVRAKIQRHTRISSIDSSLKALIAELPSFKRRLLEIEEYSGSDPLTALVDFFNAVSPWGDRKIDGIFRGLKDLNHSAYAHLLVPLETLIQHLDNAGRNQYGWNRTNVGELATEDNVFLGGIWGYWTFTVRKWKSWKNEPKGTHGWADSQAYFKTRNGYDVMCDTAQEFITSHTQPMVKLIDELTVGTSKIRLAA